jgi:hypothetical protein
VNIPIGIVATLLSAFIDKKEGDGKKKDAMEIDYIGIALLSGNPVAVLAGERRIGRLV